jgi:transposase
MEEAIGTSPRSEVAAYVGIDWADQKHDVVVRSEAEPTKVQHQVITHSPESLLDWVAEMQQRFAGKGKILVCLEQSRGALIYHLMGYELFELYPINPNQLANYRATFKNSGAKADGPDADLLCELVMCHRERLKAWKPDTELTRKLATLNEDRRQAVDRRTRLANGIKSTLKVYFPLALQVLDK